MEQVLERNVISINKNIPILDNDVLDNDEHVNNDVRIFEDDGREFKNPALLRSILEAREIIADWEKTVED